MTSPGHPSSDLVIFAEENFIDYQAFLLLPSFKIFVPISDASKSQDFSKQNPLGNVCFPFQYSSEKANFILV